MLIRDAVETDLEGLVPLARAFRAAAPHGLMFAEDETMLANAFLEQIRTGHVVVAEQDGALIGFLSSAPMRLPWSPTRMWAETAFWVDPDHRGGRACAGLLLRWIDEHRDEVLSFTSLWSDPNMASALKSVGFSPVEIGWARAPRAA